jgi:uncharacterized membrane protein YgcG
MANVQFALAPGLHSDEVLDYGTSEGIKQYRGATAPMELKFNLKSDGLHSFIEKFKNRALNQGWSGICTIPVAQAGAVAGAESPTYNLLDQFGRMSLQDIKAHALTYQFASERAAQNSHQMYQFAYTSLDEQAQARVAILEKNYCLADPEHPTEAKLFNGPLYVKTIIGCAHVDTRATAAHIRSSLSKLSAKIAELDFDIDEFSLYVKLQRSALMSRGEESSDLLVNIFDALMTVPDATFTAYVDKLKDDYNANDPKVDVDYVLLQTESKSRTMKQEGRYNVPSKADEKIIALSAECARMEALSTELQAKITAHDTQRSGRGGRGGGRGGRGGRGGEQQGGRGGRANTGRYAWKDVAPAAGTAHNKVVEGKTYHWCPNHNAWTLHKPEECRMVREEEPEADTQAQAVAAITNEHGNPFHDMD